MDLSNIIDLVTLLTVGGGLYALATIQDKRMTLMLANIKAMLESNSKTNEAWENIAKNKAQILDLLESKCDKKDDEIEELHKEIKKLRDSLDKSRTARVTAEMLRCNRISCPNRIPPFGEVPDIVKKLGEDIGETNGSNEVSC